MLFEIIKILQKGLDKNRRGTEKNSCQARGGMQEAFLRGRGRVSARVFSRRGATQKKIKFCKKDLTKTRLGVEPSLLTRGRAERRGARQWWVSLDIVL